MVANIYNKLGVINYSLEQSLDYYKKAEEILVEIHGEDHPDLGTVYANIGHCYSKLIKPKESLYYYQKRYSILERKLGIESYKTGKSYDLLSLHHNFLEQKDLALLTARKGNRSREIYTANAFKFLSQNDKLAFLNDHSPFDVFATNSNSEDLADAVLNWKGIVLDSIIDQKFKGNLQGSSGKLFSKDYAEDIFSILKDDQVLLEFIKYKHYHPERNEEKEIEKQINQLPNLDSIILPKVVFFESPFEEVLNHLEKETSRVSNEGASPSGKKIIIRVIGSETTKYPKVTVHFNSMPLSSMIKFISEITEIPYRFENDEVVFYSNKKPLEITKISSGKTQQIEKLVSQTFSLTEGDIYDLSDFDPDIFYLANEHFLNRNEKANKSLQTLITKNLKEYFKKLKLPLDGNSKYSLAYIPNFKKHPWKGGTLSISHEKKFVELIARHLKERSTKTEIFDLFFLRKKDCTR